MTRSQKKYLWIRTMAWAFCFGAGAAAAAWLGDVTGAFHCGWMEAMIFSLGGGYFPGFLGGIRKLYRMQSETAVRQ